MNQIIEVIVGPDGSTRIETQGFSGSHCRLASQFLEDALGKRTCERLTAEFHQPAAHSQGIHQDQRFS